MELKDILKKHQGELAPLFRPDLNQENTFILDFSTSNIEMKSIDFKDVVEMNSFVFEKINASSKLYGYGGYMEDREIYRRSPVFNTSSNQSRNIHLGVDVWTPDGKPVHCPLNALVHSFKNNNNYGDYGPTIILEHQLAGNIFYTLYGHLSLDSITGLYEGKIIQKGEAFCKVGNFPVNGDWPPHLHFQIIADMQGNKGDFPGVCSAENKMEYAKLCPDPVVFFSF